MTPKGGQELKLVETCWFGFGLSCWIDPPSKATQGLRGFQKKTVFAIPLPLGGKQFGMVESMKHCCFLEPCHQGYKGGGQNFAAMKEDDAEVQQLFVDKLQAGINFDKYDNIPVEVSPADPSTPPIAMFQHLQSLHASVMANIQRAGYQRPTPVQKYGLPVICAGKDLMACAQTGSGKTGECCMSQSCTFLQQHSPSATLQPPPFLK